ncbi:hypothetical protein E2C01_084915 [Portunus trituberculatus]|uniref:Secreted protein n=1 Tax=Portunus trituberculatus TaxID=210409 RepID=A0A5B7IWL4_PORTR|nr:hypothetical protein [Portunus trituberculatus]
MGAAGCGAAAFVLWWRAALAGQRGGRAALSTCSIASLGVWRMKWAALASRLLRRPPATGWMGRGGGGLRAAVAGHDRR